MFTEQYKRSQMVSPRVGRPVNNHAVGTKGHWSDRSHLASRRPEMPRLDRRHVTSIRIVHGQTSLSRVPLTGVPFKGSSSTRGDFVSPGADRSHAEWESLDDMEEAKSLRRTQDSQQAASEKAARDAERTRQEELEEPKLENAFFHTTAKLQHDKDREMIEFDRRGAVRRGHILQQQDAERSGLEIELAATLGRRRVKYSSRTQNMQVTTKMLARLHRYEEWADVHRELTAREEKERRHFHDGVAQQMEVRRARLADAQQKALGEVVFRGRNSRFIPQSVDQETDSFLSLH